jgi:DNA-binding NarL/FixJ family response regulator
MAISILLADDHAVVRDGLRALLRQHADLAVVAEAGTGSEAVRQALAVRPDVVVMDITMPEMNGIDAAAEIRRQCPSTQVIILSVHATSEYVYRALKAGASGYVLKESAGQEVVTAIRAVHAGKRCFSAAIQHLVESGAVGAPSPDAPAERSPIERLSPREREVLQLVVEGWSSADIGVRLSLSPKTVETYRSRVMAKLGIHDLPGLVRFAVAHGLTPG